MKKKFVLFVLLFLYTGAFSQIKFHTDFESGAMGDIHKVDSVDFSFVWSPNKNPVWYIIEGKKDPKHPFIQNHTPSTRWFYFSVTGVKEHHLNLIFESDALRPFYSYDNKIWHRFSAAEAPIRKIISKTFTQDTVYIAYFQPYTYSRLTERISEWEEKMCVKIDTIGYSTQNRAMYAVKITDSTIPDEKKKSVYIHARQHPSETPSSWLTEGLIDFFSSQEKEAVSLRKQMILYAIPMTNPDGVYNGLSRSNTQGIDLEGNFNCSDDSTAIEVINIKNYLSGLTSTKNIDVALNVHSQVADYSTFWIHTAASTNSDFLRRQFILAGLTSSVEEYMHIKDMKFSKLAPHYPEGWFWNNTLDETLAITVETPYSYYSNYYDKKWLDADNLKLFGKHLIESVAQTLNISSASKIMIEPSIKKRKITNSSDFTYISENRGKITGKKRRVKYLSENVPIGNYRLYRYDGGENKEQIGDKTYGWKYVTEIHHPKAKRLKFKLILKKGEYADMILLEKK